MSAREPETARMGFIHSADHRSNGSDTDSRSLNCASHSESAIEEETPEDTQTKREASDDPEGLTIPSGSQGSDGGDGGGGSHDNNSATLGPAPQSEGAVEEEIEGEGEAAGELRRTEVEYSDNGSQHWEEAVSSPEEGSILFQSDEDSDSSSSSNSSEDSPKTVADEPAADAEGNALGCAHYRRKCKVVAPCCKEIYWCRHCHNEAYEMDLSNAHEIDRHAVEEIVCAVCEARQPVSNKCVGCGTVFGAYFCSVCKFWDNLGEKKKVYHCDECGICRLGGRENYFHCPTCGSCYPMQLQNKHKCLENAMHRQCPVCLEDMFSSLRQSQVLQCGHTIHSDCLRLLQKQKGFQAIRCPMCSKSIADYSEFWKQLSEEIERTPMEEQMRRKVRIACNDCLERCTTDFHFLGLKCLHCNSFNTRDVAED
ncbi:zinc finger (CHY type) protein, putative [Eimeria tenella]|uniref:Zinc finger (CHY type) protein, putative n=1 Tax=Eimeria tenella TaxID=5802 RepID=U6KSG8_EIMTE|nr:zinc finger (CHY type) protein, putative [Eimeria tenella]CDJ38348.1 zinc finger (CHY type) protein, putative [Eimeria tenella]|eukprot:XP_013229186.1 zinc finger (CHY type) protein, putative [Eimeria tenella]